MITSFIREDDDPFTDARISIGCPRESDDFYFVFRGDPDQVVALLERVIPIAKEALTAREYKDHRRGVI